MRDLWLCVPASRRVCLSRRGLHIDRRDRQDRLARRRAGGRRRRSCPSPAGAGPPLGRTAAATAKGRTRWRRLRARGPPDVACRRRGCSGAAAGSRRLCRGGAASERKLVAASGGGGREPAPAASAATHRRASSDTADTPDHSRCTRLYAPATEVALEKGKLAPQSQADGGIRTPDPRFTRVIWRRERRTPEVAGGLERPAIRLVWLARAVYLEPAS
jgi:hypothetical protein